MERQALSPNVVPRHYDDIKLDTDSETFIGNVVIEIELLRQLSSICTNSPYIVPSSEVRTGSRILHVQHDLREQLILILLEHPLPANSIIFVQQSFTGRFAGSEAGLQLPMHLNQQSWHLHWSSPGLQDQSSLVSTSQISGRLSHSLLSLLDT